MAKSKAEKKLEKLEKLDLFFNASYFAVAAIIGAIVTPASFGVIATGASALATGVFGLGAAKVSLALFDTGMAMLGADGYQDRFSEVAECAVKGCTLMLIGSQIVGGVHGIENKAQKKAANKASNENTKRLEEKRSTLPKKGELTTATNFLFEKQNGEVLVFDIPKSDFESSVVNTLCG